MSLTSREMIKANTEDAVALLTIDHPPVNALCKSLLNELDSALDEIQQDDGIKAVLITGSGAMAFAAGADIKEMAQIQSSEEALAVSQLGQKVLMRIENFPKPVIAAINGVCLGGGLELAMACHIRIAGDRTRFGQPEITLGIIPAWGGTQRLPRLIGKAKAIEWILTGDVYPAQEAARLGLINLMVPQDQVIKSAKGLAKKITSKGKIPAQQALKVIVQGYDKPLAESMGVEAEAFKQVAECEDSKEGIKAFIEKRQPRFTDR